MHATVIIFTESNLRYNGSQHKVCPRCVTLGRGHNYIWGGPGYLWKIGFHSQIKYRKKVVHPWKIGHGVQVCMLNVFFRINWMFFSGSIALFISIPFDLWFFFASALECRDIETMLDHKYICTSSTNWSILNLILGPGVWQLVLIVDNQVVKRHWLAKNVLGLMFTYSR